MQNVRVAASRPAAVACGIAQREGCVRVFASAARLSAVRRLELVDSGSTKARVSWRGWKCLLDAISSEAVEHVTVAGCVFKASAAKLVASESGARLRSIEYRHPSEERSYLCSAHATTSVLEHLGAMLASMPVLSRLRVEKGFFLRADFVAIVRASTDGGQRPSTVECLVLGAEGPVSHFDRDVTTALTLTALFDALSSGFPYLTEAEFLGHAATLQLRTPPSDEPPPPPYVAATATDGKRRAPSKKKKKKKEEEEEEERSPAAAAVLEDEAQTAAVSKMKTNWANQRAVEGASAAEASRPAFERASSSPESIEAEAYMSATCTETALNAPRLGRLKKLSLCLQIGLGPYAAAQVAAYVAAACPALAELTFEMPLRKDAQAHANCALVVPFLYGLRTTTALRTLTLRAVYSGASDEEQSVDATQTVTTRLPASLRKYTLVFAHRRDKQLELAAARAVLDAIEPPRAPTRAAVRIRVGFESEGRTQWLR